ncbi:MAG: hypothetical protein Q4D56_06330 [Bacteroides sp.]|nr:hypothetical protein [Bacteroides sp.]
MKDFIKTAITDIVDAVREAQDAVKDVATVVPFVKDANSVPHIKTAEGFANVSNVDFDIAVTTETNESADNGVKAGIQVAGLLNFGAGVKDAASEKHQNVSRIKFSVPVILPHSAVPDELATTVVGGISKQVARKHLPNNSTQ